MNANSQITPEMIQEDMRYLQLLSRSFPTIAAASSEIINLEAIVNLPKGTEHFLADLHGEYEAFQHVLRNASGAIKRKVKELFGDTLSDIERKELCTLIYYPEQKLHLVKSVEKDLDIITLYKGERNMEENQMPKKRNYERYLEGETWSKDPFEEQGSLYEQPAYQEPVYQEPAYVAPESVQTSYGSDYSQPVTPQSYDGLEEPVTKGEWALCYFLMMIPCVGFIMMFVWAFSSSEKKSNPVLSSSSSMLTI